MNPLSIILAISLIANAALGYAYLGKRDTAVAATTNLEHAGADVTTCNASVDNLDTQAKARAEAAAAARKGAASAAAVKNAKADTILSTPAAEPGDDCKSSTTRVNNWFKDAP